MNNATRLYEATEILLIDSIKADVMYARAMEWIALNYVSAKDAVQYTNPVDRKIIVKGSIPVFFFLKEGWVRHTLTLEFKDGRYRYLYTDLVYTSPGSGDMPLESRMVGKKKLLKITEEKIMEAAFHIYEYIGSYPKKDTW